MICEGCNSEITQVNVIEKTQFYVSDTAITNGGGGMSVTCAGCNHHLSEQQLHVLGFLK